MIIPVRIVFCPKDSSGSSGQNDIKPDLKSGTIGMIEDYSCNINPESG